MGLYVDSGSIYETQQTTGEQQLGYVGGGAASWTVAAWPVSRSPQAGRKNTSQQHSSLNPSHMYACTLPAGATAMLECLAFKASQHRDTLRIMKEVRSYPGSFPGFGQHQHQQGARAGV